MPHEETWIKINCPKCKKANWICEGDMQDCTAPDTEAIECWDCNHKWWRDPSMAKDTHGEDEDTSMDEYLNDYAEKGQSEP